ncbi:UvrD-helicase domain-containing protein, partial [Streptomyces violascens]|uniref:UvrD-helicase domain-containing protein n=1 Tax=Streptomyces violascens TaxID=67381 RepID=UPI0036A22187
MNPTDEQVQAADRFRAGEHLCLQAGAGTGKTATLAMLAAATKRRGRYLAFNKAIAHDATARFPSTVTCRTAHSLAYAAVGHRYARRLNGPRQPGGKTGASLGLTRELHLGDRVLSPWALSHAVLRTVTRFCQSADPDLAPHHVPTLRGLDDCDHHAALVDTVLPFARKAWTDLQHPDDGVVRFDHDHYLKIWALSQPAVAADFLLLDEAQDTNPVVEQVFTAQRNHAQLVMVGDSAQAIYGWRGATDVMARFTGTPLTLSQSFRFGPRLADEANRWLALAGAPLRLRGSDSIPTQLAPLEQPDAILCRTNVGAMTHLLAHLDTGHRVALVGGGNGLRTLAEAAQQLKEGRRASHPELFLFATWAELQDYAQHDPAGAD